MYNKAHVFITHKWHKGLYIKTNTRHFNQFTSGILYFFRSPVRDYFQWKFGKNLYPLKMSLSMKWCPDNQTNASFIDISRIKWLVFLLQSSFFHTTSTVASSEAPADYRPAPGRQTAFRRDIKDNGYKFVFTHLWLERQRNRSWIRDYAKLHKRVNSFIDGGTEACSRQNY